MGRIGVALAVLFAVAGSAIADCGGWVLFGQGGPAEGGGLFSIGPPQPWLVAHTRADCEEGKANNIAFAMDLVNQMDRPGHGEGFKRWAVTMLQLAVEERCIQTYTWENGKLVTPEALKFKFEP